MKLSKDEEILFKHYKDLIRLSYTRGIPVYSPFGSYRQIELGFLALDEFYSANGYSENVQYQLYGGYDDAERQMFCFMGDSSYQNVTKYDFPISCVCISPVNKKYCDSLNHRDYLGTVMGLGLKREQIGDILVVNDPNSNSCVCYMFCKSDKVDLISEIVRVKHTTVKVEAVDFTHTNWSPTFKEIVGSVSSFRLDAIMALAIKSSRSQTLELVSGGNVVLNGRCCTENAKKINPGDIFSIRGYGKFIFDNTSSISKKGRYRITINKYI